jgi:single-strand DNA-binding protein
MSAEVVGTIKLIMDEETFKSGFVKRDFVVTTDEKYPQNLKFSVVKDKTKLLDKFSVGDIVKVSYNLRGSEYKGRYYVELNAWAIYGKSSPNTGNGFPF